MGCGGPPPPPVAPLDASGPSGVPCPGPHSACGSVRVRVLRVCSATELQPDLRLDPPPPCPLPPRPASPPKSLHRPPPPSPPLCDMPSGCCSFTGPRTVARSSLRVLRRVSVFGRLLRPGVPRGVVSASAEPIRWPTGAVLVAAPPPNGNLQSRCNRILPSQLAAATVRNRFPTRSKAAFAAPAALPCGPPSLEAPACPLPRKVRKTAQWPLVYPLPPARGTPSLSGLSTIPPFPPPPPRPPWPKMRPGPRTHALCLCIPQAPEHRRPQCHRWSTAIDPQQVNGHQTGGGLHVAGEPAGPPKATANAHNPSRGARVSRSGAE